MLPLRQHRPPYMKELTGHLVEYFGADLLTQIQIPPHRDDPSATRRQLAGMLAGTAGGNREPLKSSGLVSSGGCTVPATTSRPQQGSA